MVTLSQISLDLYLDESGSFHDDRIDPRHPAEKSLVGGLLCDPAVFTDELINTLLPMKVHACNGYQPCFLDALEAARARGGRFVVFENAERIKVINDDVTYLNIISEGLVKLMRDLSLAHPEGVALRVVIATRKAMSASSGIIRYNEYLTRLEEKLFMALGRNHVTGCTHAITFADARKYKRLDFADLICNTYLTRSRADKFGPAEQARIRAMYENELLYPVFEDATVGYVRQLVFERHLGEAMSQLCALPRLTHVRRLQTRIIAALKDADPAELKTWFTYMSLQLDQYNRLHLYAEGIRFAENYLAYFLRPLEANDTLRRDVAYWIFDTHFFLLTMHDHLGNATACSACMKLCQDSLHVIDHSWEHLDYYFRYRIREMNVMMGRFDFERVMKTSEGLISILSQAKDLFGMIETFDGQPSELRSGLLGRVYGVRLEACINLMHRDPSLFDEGLRCSDLALAEFTAPGDLRQQYQYRCMLLAEAGRADEALQSLLDSHRIAADDPQAFHHFLDSVYARRRDSFGLWHYTRVMLLFLTQHDSRAADMHRALTACPRFMADWRSAEAGGHPWNLVLWNMSRYLRATGNLSASEEWLKKALDITMKQPGLTTMTSFALSMCADKLLWYSRHPRDPMYPNAARAYRNTLRQFLKGDLPDTMRAWFEPNQDEGALQRIAHEYLK